jgi:iron complex transport system ATP-binding protein
MTPALCCRELSVRFGSRVVLDRVTLSLEPGRLVALLGPNGSGKTTLLRALAGLVRRESGEVLLNGQDVRSVARRMIAQHVAYLPQAPTVLETQRVSELLLAGRLPHRGPLGFDTPSDVEIVRDLADRLELAELLDRQLGTLSGGQRQRAFIGRCLAQQPRVLLLDEPATYLDLRHQVELHRLLRRLADEQRLAVLLASHDFNLAATHCDELVLLDDGRVVAQGDGDTVMRPELIERVYGVKVRRAEIDGEIVLVPTR